MKADPNETIGGQSIKTVRGLLRDLRAWGDTGFHAETVARLLRRKAWYDHVDGMVARGEIDPYSRRYYKQNRCPKNWPDQTEPAKALIAALLDCGLIEPFTEKFRRSADDRLAYTATIKGAALEGAKFIPRISKAKGAQIVSALVERARAINADPNLLYYVEALLLFGSMLDPNAGTIGDVDVACTLARRDPPEGGSWHEWNIQRCDATSGRQSADWRFQMRYGQTEVERLLAGRVRSLSLATKDALDDLEGATVQQIFAAGEIAGSPCRPMKTQA